MASDRSLDLSDTLSFLYSFWPDLFKGLVATAFPALVMVAVVRYIPKENRGKAFGLIGSLVAMGEGVGPAIGGMIAHYIHWSYLSLFRQQQLSPFHS